MTYLASELVFGLFYLDLIVAFGRNTLSLNECVEFFASHFGNVNSFDFFIVCIEENHFGRFTGNSFEGSSGIFRFQVLEDEGLHLGELVQSSPGARFNPARVNVRIFAISLEIEIFRKCF